MVSDYSRERHDSGTGKKWESSKEGMQYSDSVMRSERVKMRQFPHSI